MIKDDASVEAWSTLTSPFKKCVQDVFIVLLSILLVKRPQGNANLTFDLLRKTKHVICKCMLIKVAYKCNWPPFMELEPGICLNFIVCLYGSEFTYQLGILCLTQNFKIKTLSQPRNIEFCIPNIHFGGRCKFIQFHISILIKHYVVSHGW